MNTENNMQMPSTPVHFVVKSAEDYRACYFAYEQADKTLVALPYGVPPHRSVAWERADAERTLALANLALAQITLLRVAREGQ